MTRHGTAALPSGAAALRIELSKTGSNVYYQVATANIALRVAARIAGRKGTGDGLLQRCFAAEST
jgi:hypothetical protein